MANTATILATSRTPLSVVIQITNDGTSAASASLTRTNLLAALLAGPLKALLYKTADWSTFVATGTNTHKIRISSILGGTTSDIDIGTNPAVVTWQVDSLDLSFNPPAPATARSFYIELRALASHEK